MSNIVIITPKDGNLGERARAKVAQYGNKFIPATEQNGTLIAFTLDGQQGVAFHETEADWKIVQD